MNLKNLGKKSFPFIIVFITSFCLMVIEIVAGRVMAPYLGVSLFTWTSVIGVVLAGISLGNYIGGRIADKRGNRNTLSIIFFLAGIFTLTIVPLAYYIGNYLYQGVLPLHISTLVFSLIVFFIPSILLSTITPIIIKLTLHDLEKTGRTVGQIYAFSTIGSIVGTFATGFFLIMLMGTKMIIFSVAGILILLGFYFVGSKIFLKKSHYVIVILIIGAFALGTNIPSVCHAESNYYCIDIDNIKIGERDVSVMVIDSLDHSYLDLEDVNWLGYQYEKLMATALEYKSKDSAEPLNTLFLGGGAYILPRYLEENYPDSIIEMVEIDPMVTSLNYSDLKLDPNTTIKTYIEDARIFLNRINQNKKYDIIYGDTFHDLAVPYHLTTNEFNLDIKKYLKENGIYAVNIVDNATLGSFLSSYIYTLSKTFDYVYLAPWHINWLEINDRATFMIMASDTKLDIDKWNEAASTLVDKGIIFPEEINNSKLLIFDEELTSFLDKTDSVLLTDDYAPVENLLLPIFIESTKK